MSNKPTRLCVVWGTFRCATQRGKWPGLVELRPALLGEPPTAKRTMQRLPGHPNTPATVAAHDTLMTTPGQLAEEARIPFDTFAGPAVPPTSHAIDYATPQRQALVARLEHLEAQIEARTSAGEASSRFDHELFTLRQLLEANVAQLQD